MIVDTNNLRTVKQYTAESGLANRTVYLRIHCGKIKYVKIGDLHLIITDPKDGATQEEKGDE